MKNLIFSYLFLLFGFGTSTAQTGFKEYFYSQEDMEKSEWSPEKMILKDSIVVYDTIFSPFEGATNKELLKGFYLWFYEVMLPSATSSNFTNFIEDDMTNLKFDGNFIVKFWNGASHKYAVANIKMEFYARYDSLARLIIKEIRYNNYERDFISLPVIQAVKGIKQRAENEKRNNSDQENSFQFAIETNLKEYQEGNRLEYNRRFCTAFHLSIMTMQSLLFEFLTKHISDFREGKKNDWPDE